MYPTTLNFKIPCTTKHKNKIIFKKSLKCSIISPSNTVLGPDYAMLFLAWSFALLTGSLSELTREVYLSDYLFLPPNNLSLMLEAEE